MAKGRKKTPTAILKKRGSWRAKVRKHEPVYKAASDITPPKELTRVGLQLWRKVFPMIIGQGVLTQVDIAAFTRYCVYWQKWKTLINKRNTKLTDLCRLEAVILKLEVQFGLTPASRPNVKAEKVNENNSKEKHIYFKKVG